MIATTKSVLKNNMSFFRSPFKVTTPEPTLGSKTTSTPSAEVSEVMDALTVGKVPSQYIAGVKKHLRVILEDKQHRAYSELIARSSHPCLREYLVGVLELLQKQIDNSNKVMQGMKPAELADFKLSVEQQKEAYYVGIAEMLGRGFDIVLKPNLVFDSSGANPIGVREKDQKRFPLCQESLSGKSAGRRKTIKKKHQKKHKTLRRRKMGRKMH